MTRSFRTRRVLLACTLLACAGFAARAAHVRRDEPVKPAPTEKQSPDATNPTTATGIAVKHADKFAAAAEYSAKHQGHGVLVMHKGEVIFEQFSNGWRAEMPHPLASGTKSFTGIAAMFAVQDGLFTLDEKVCDTIIEWKGDPLKSQITVRHLLNLSSGLQPDGAPGKPKNDNGGRNTLERSLRDTMRDDWFGDAIAAPMTGKPGAQFAYGGNHFYAFGAFLERKLKASNLPAAQKDVWGYYSARIFQPLGITIGRIGKDKQGHPNLPGGASLTAREWVKFGQFVNLNGAVRQPDGSLKQLLKPELLAECFKPSEKNPAYGLTFWLKSSRPGVDTPNGDPAEKDPAPEADKPAAKPDAPAENPRERLRERVRDRMMQQAVKKEMAEVVGPDGKPLQVRLAAGLGKQRLLMIPQCDLVVVRFGELQSENSKYDDRDLLKPIIEAIAAETDWNPQPKKK